jgi:hypothetical protein
MQRKPLAGAVMSWWLSRNEPLIYGYDFGCDAEWCSYVVMPARFVKLAAVLPQPTSAADLNGYNKFTVARP